MQAGLLRHWRWRLRESNDVHVRARRWCSLASWGWSSRDIRIYGCRFFASSPAEKRACLARSQRLGLGLSAGYPAALDQIPEMRAWASGVQCPQARRVASHLLTVPVHHWLRPRDRQAICECLHTIATPVSRAGELSTASWGHIAAADEAAVTTKGRHHMIANALSVDVEEYTTPASSAADDRPHGQRQFESRVQQSLDDLLELFSAHSVKATFFVLGEIAAAHPGLLRTIAAEGHEVACHGDRHEDVYRLSPREFRAESAARSSISKTLVGTAVIGYRAPNFSIGRAQSWAYQILSRKASATTRACIRSSRSVRPARRAALSVTRSGAMAHEPDRVSDWHGSRAG